LYIRFRHNQDKEESEDLETFQSFLRQIYLEHIIKEHKMSIGFKQSANSLLHCLNKNGKVDINLYIRFRHNQDEEESEDLETFQSILRQIYLEHIIKVHKMSIGFKQSANSLLHCLNKNGKVDINLYIRFRHNQDEEESEDLEMTVKQSRHGNQIIVTFF
jgi:hypothetical protein